MSQDSPVYTYLVGATWCGYTKAASSDLEAASRRPSDPIVQVQNYNVNDVVTRVYCDVQADATIPQSNLCLLAKSGYPVLVGCIDSNCQVLINGYSTENYASNSAKAILDFASGV